MFEYKDRNSPIREKEKEKHCLRAAITDWGRTVKRQLPWLT